VPSLARCAKIRCDMGGKMATPDLEIDVERLRTERLARLQTAMRAHDLDGCLLFSEPNTRYATGAVCMPVWSMSTFTRCAVVPAEGDPILFEHPNSVHRSRLRAVDVRPIHAWEFYDDAGAQARTFADEAVAALRELDVTANRVGVDRIGAPGFLALQGAGLTLVDSSPATQEAREIKTSQEIVAMRRTGADVVQALGTLREALRPGVTERELHAVYAAAMLPRGAEYFATNTVCAGPNTNPWRAEATDRAIETGELVYIDTDTVGLEGMFFCVSRAFVCGDEPTPAQRELYRIGHDWIRDLTALVRPGVTCAELAATAPPIPERFLPQRYEVMIHSVGLEEESPSVCHPQDKQSNPDRVIRKDMALVVELYLGEVGAREGVKLGDEILVGAAGTEVLAPFPWEDALLA
jgi:Xaa-Pro aminopeptidase